MWSFFMSYYKIFFKIFFYYELKGTKGDII